MPTEPFPEIKVPAPAAVPPIVLPRALLMKTPSRPFGTALVPLGSVPFLLPSMRLPEAVAPAASAI